VFGSGVETLKRQPMMPAAAEQKDIGGLGGSNLALIVCERLRAVLPSRVDLRGS